MLAGGIVATSLMARWQGWAARFACLTVVPLLVAFPVGSVLYVLALAIAVGAGFTALPAVFLSVLLFGAIKFGLPALVTNLIWAAAVSVPTE